MPAPRPTAHLLRPLLLLAGLALPVLPVLAQESYEERWIRLADAHAALVAEEAGSAFQARLLEQQAGIARSVEERCGRAGRRSGMASFQAVMVLAADGRVEELLPMPRSPHFRCFEKEMQRQRFPAPPSAPFYQVLRFDLPAG
jgi:hypothetical protein